MIEILRAGVRTTIQDRGRIGYYHLGVPPSGAKDRTSYMLGNIILGNPDHFAALEMMIEGPIIEFKTETTAVITGAPVCATLNGDPLPNWEVFNVKKGDILSLDKITEGLFSYLCISGGFQVPEILGSKSTCLASGFSYISGRPLVAGDIIPIATPLPGANRLAGKVMIEDAIPKFNRSQTVHVVLGIHIDLISDEGLVSLLNNEWTITTKSSSTASRLQGGTIKYKDYDPPFGSGGMKGNVVDIPYPIGGVILPNEEEIIILLHDGTGGGGFVTIGTIIWQDISMLSQMRPLSTVKFRSVTIEEAMAIRKEYEKKINDVRTLLNQ